jgi:hypothetical protein
MEQIVIHVKNKEKAKLLFEFLSAVDFIDFIDADAEEILETHNPSEPADFFALAGLWEGRELSLESIRQQAWPRQS